MRSRIRPESASAEVCREQFPESRKEFQQLVFSPDGVEMAWWREACQTGDRFCTNAFEVAGSGVVSGTTFLDMRKLVPSINGRVNFKAFPNPVAPAVDGSDRTQGDPRE